MYIKDLKNCKEIIARDYTILKEIYNPAKEEIKVKHSLAHATVKPGDVTYKHRLRSTEIYYILEGKGEMHIDEEVEKVSAGQAVYIPPNSVQRIKNTGDNDLIFLAIVDPAWKADDEDILENK